MKRRILTPAEAGRKGAAARNAKLTAAERSANARQGAKALNASLTPAQRSRNARRAARARWA